MPAQIDLTYTGNFRCTARHITTGHLVHTDLTTSQGGLGDAFSATDLLVTALASCIVTTMALVAQRHGIDLTGVSAIVEKDMTTVPVRRVGPVGITISMPVGLRLSAADRERLENAAKKCPVKQSFHPDIEIRVEFVYPSEAVECSAKA